MAAHNIYVLGQMWAFRRWELRKIFTLEEYIEITNRLIIGGMVEGGVDQGEGSFLSVIGNKKSLNKKIL